MGVKTTLSVTVFDEESILNKLFDSLFNQTNGPDEIVMVDAGSTDNTVEIIERYKKRKFKNLKLIISNGASIAKGRNIAVRNSRNSVIVMTDAGCMIHKDWLRKITEPFENPETDVVAGFYKMTGNSNFQKAVAPFLGIVPQKFDPNAFLPSTRSIAFRKSVWKKVGGFSEKFDRAGEDTDFNLKLKRHGFKIVRVKDALVDWEVPNNLILGAKKFYYYARGDAQSNNLLTSHNIHVYTIFLRYIVFFLLIILSFFTPLLVSVFVFMFGLYLFWSVYKMRNFIMGWKARLIVPIIQVVSDFSVMAGFISGIWGILNK